MILSQLNFVFDHSIGVKLLFSCFVRNLFSSFFLFQILVQHFFLFIINRDFSSAAKIASLQF